jgi:hypothetical protein
MYVYVSNIQCVHKVHLSESCTALQNFSTLYYKRYQYCKQVIELIICILIFFTDLGIVNRIGCLLCPFFLLV